MNIIKYISPARDWNEALPVGGGRLGAMVYGGIEEETVQFNEETLWSGYPGQWNNPRAKELLPELRRLILDKKYAEADKLGNEMLGKWAENYLPFGNLRIKFGHGIWAKNYERRLVMDDALAVTEYSFQDVRYKRTVFASYPDGVIVQHMEAEGPGTLDLHITMDSLLRYRIAADDGALVMSGYAPEYCEFFFYNAPGGIRYGEETTTRAMRFQAMAKVDSDGDVEVCHDGIRVRNAKKVTIYISAVTSYPLGACESSIEELSARNRKILQRAMAMPYETLLGRHTDDHGALFSRVSLDLGGPDMAGMDVGKRIQDFDGSDRGLAALMFQYGRYLLIASSRPGTLAANMLGVWNNETQAAWSGYTLDINTEMNYWPAMVTNLAECEKPLFDLIGKVSKTGAETARVNYGARGWVTHSNTDIWGHSGPTLMSPLWGLWTMSGAWMCRHLWER